jgi:hypothetical protein
VAAEFGDQRGHAGGVRVASRSSSIPLVAVHQQPAGAAGQIDHVRAPLVEDQVKAGTQPAPAFSAPRANSSAFVAGVGWNSRGSAWRCPSLNACPRQARVGSR